MNNSICTLFDNILIDIHKFKSLHRKETASGADLKYLKIGILKAASAGYLLTLGRKTKGRPSAGDKV